MIEIQYRPKKTDLFTNGEKWHVIDHDTFDDCRSDLLHNQWPALLLDVKLIEVDEEAGETLEDIWEDLDLSEVFEFRVETDESKKSMTDTDADEWVNMLCYQGEDTEDRVEAYIDLHGTTYYSSNYNGMIHYDTAEAYGTMLYESNDEFVIPSDAMPHFDFQAYGEYCLAGCDYVETNGGIWMS